MSDLGHDDDQGEGDEGAPEARESTGRDIGRDNFRQLRAMASRTVAAEKALDTLRTEVALRDLDLTGPQIVAVLALHGDGERTPEAYAATAATLAFLPVEQTTPEERAAHQRMSDLTAGASPSEAYKLTLVDEINATKSPEELTALLARAGRLATDY